MSKIIPIAVIVAVVLAAFAFLVGPIWCFYDLRSSAESEDVQSLAKLIDFDRVRAGLKSQLEAGSAGVAAPPPSVVNDPAGAAGDIFKKGADAVGKVFNDIINPQAAKPAPPPPDPEPYLKPRALLALSYGAGRNAPKTDPKSMQAKPVPKVTYWSLDRARLSIKAKGEGKTIFTFERAGIFRWHLVHIGLPEIVKGPPPALTANPPPNSAASTSAVAKPVPAAAKPLSASASASAKPSPVE